MSDAIAQSTAEGAQTCLGPRVPSASGVGAPPSLLRYGLPRHYDRMCSCPHRNRRRGCAEAVRPVDGELMFDASCRTAPDRRTTVRSSAWSQPARPCHVFCAAIATSAAAVKRKGRGSARLRGAEYGLGYQVSELYALPDVYYLCRRRHSPVSNAPTVARATLHCAFLTVKARLFNASSALKVLGGLNGSSFPGD